jgi:hypothetical protein
MASGSLWSSYVPQLLSFTLWVPTGVSILGKSKAFHSIKRSRRLGRRIVYPKGLASPSYFEIFLAIFLAPRDDRLWSSCFSKDSPGQLSVISHCEGFPPLRWLKLNIHPMLFFAGILNIKLFIIFSLRIWISISACFLLNKNQISLLKIILFCYFQKNCS